MLSVFLLGRIFVILVRIFGAGGEPVPAQPGAPKNSREIQSVEEPHAGFSLCPDPPRLL